MEVINFTLHPLSGVYKLALLRRLTQSEVPTREVRCHPADAPHRRGLLFWRRTGRAAGAKLASWFLQYPLLAPDDLSRQNTSLVMRQIVEGGDDLDHAMAR